MLFVPCTQIRILPPLGGYAPSPTLLPRMFLERSLRLRQRRDIDLKLFLFTLGLPSETHSEKRQKVAKFLRPCSCTPCGTDPVPPQYPARTIFTDTNPGSLGLSFKALGSRDRRHVRTLSRLYRHTSPIPLRECFMRQVKAPAQSHRSSTRPYSDGACQNSPKQTWITHEISLRWWCSVVRTRWRGVR